MVRSANRSRVLIIGGAEGGSLREVLRWLEVKHVDMVDIDEELVQLCRKHLSDVYGNSWSDERVNLHFIDGHTFLNQGLLYDVIILDLSEASEGSPAQKLFTREFYELVRSHLLPGGVVSVQSEWLYSQFHVNLTATQRAAFSAVQPMEVNIPSFLISEAFNLCVTDIAQLKRNPEEIDRIMEAGGVCGLHYYSGAIDKKMSTLPLYFLERYKNADKIFTDLTLPQIHNECCSTPIEPHKNRN
jgi:spermidine synthase